MNLTARIRNAWNAFRDSENRTKDLSSSLYGNYYRPDRNSFHFGTERSIVASIYTRIGVDAAAIDMLHVRKDQNGKYTETINDSLNQCLTVSANIDQTGRAFRQDVAQSLCDEGCVAVVPVDTNDDPDKGTYDILSLRVGPITEWYPDAVRIKLYNDRNGQKEEIVLPKTSVAIIENPLFAVMNEPNSTLKRLIRKLNILDAIDEQSGAGKLDLIIQLPFVIKTEQRRAEAEKRIRQIERQLAGSKYGIAYTDGTERVVQLNRAVENNLMDQITYLTNMLYSQLGMSEAILNGTANEVEMLNYYTRTLEPIIAAISQEMSRKFLTQTARTQGQDIMYFRDPFKLVPAEKIAEIVDKLSRNAILSSNELRALIGYKPVDDPKADELSNKNLNQTPDETPPSAKAEQNGSKEGELNP